MSRALLTAAFGILLLTAPRVAHAQRYGDGDRRVAFEVVRSREVIRPCEQCGYGYREDYRPGDGVFLLETRRYTEFRRGFRVRTWTETAEVFLHCYDRHDRGPRR